MLRLVLAKNKLVDGALVRGDSGGSDNASVIGPTSVAGVSKVESIQGVDGMCAEL